MRLSLFLILSVFLVGISSAQSTNFPVEPQYLITTSSTMMIRPIATPSLSLGEGQPVTASVSAAEINPEQASSPSRPSDTYLGSVYWGKHKSTDLVARCLDTPSMAPSDTAWYMNAVSNQLVSASAAVSGEAAEVLSGSRIIELTGAPIRSNLPASVLDVGVTGLGDVQSLAARGYGVPLGDVAAYWKSHKRLAPRVYRNSDVVGPRG